MRFIYLHGFNSAFDSTNEKIVELSKLGEVVGITYKSLGTYDDIYEDITSKVAELDPDRDDTVIVGTSMGGFWAAEIASSMSLMSVLINPCCDPTNMLLKYLGLNRNFKTGESTIFTNSSAKSYLNTKPTDLRYEYMPLVLLDMGDELIDANVTKELLKGFPMAIWEGGTHQFSHMPEALEEISKYINHCSYAEDLNN